MIFEARSGVGLQDQSDPTSQPLDVVASAFEGFSGKKPGGTVLSVGPRLSSQDPAYRVESSFTQEQQPFINAVTTGLARCMTGRLSTEGISTEPLRVGIVESFLASKRNNYAGVLTGEVTRKITEFNDMYPNLYPALRAMFLQAGREGTELAISVSSVHLLAESGRSDEFDLFEMFQKKYSKRDFTNSHPGNVPIKAREYEVWCSGRNVAEAIMRESGLAAQMLHQIPGVLDGYRPSRNSFPPFENDVIADRINALLEDLEQRYETE